MKSRSGAAGSLNTARNPKERDRLRTQERKTAAFHKRMKSITTPTGFTGRFETHYDDPVFVLEKDGDTRITFYQRGHGSTEFTVGGKPGWLTFDRTGVESSFYHVKLYRGDDRTIDLNAIIKAQLERIAKRREYYKTAIAVPGLPSGGWTVQPDGVTELKARLKEYGHVTFTPSGFGTGYTVTKKRAAGRYGVTRAKPDLEAFLGYSPLFVIQMDCD